MARSGDAWGRGLAGLRPGDDVHRASSGTSQEGTLGGSVAAMRRWELGGRSAPAVFNPWIKRLQPSGLLPSTALRVIC